MSLPSTASKKSPPPRLITGEEIKELVNEESKGPAAEEEEKVESAIKTSAPTVHNTL